MVMRDWVFLVCILFQVAAFLFCILVILSQRPGRKR